MERRLQKIIFVFLMSILLPLWPQDVSQERMVRFAVWASMEAFPGIEQVEKDAYALPVKKIREITPLILSGMVYGWKFEYVPYDKARGVQEYFEFTPLHEFSKEEMKQL